MQGLLAYLLPIVLYVSYVHAVPVQGSQGVNGDFTTVSLNADNVKANNIIHTFLYLPKIYTVSFSLKVTEIVYEWHSVLHFTEGGDYANFGDRIPGVFIRGNILGISSSINKPNNIYFYNNFPQDKWVNITVEYSKVGLTYWYTVNVDGKEVKKEQNLNSEVYKNVKVYAGDKWYPPFKGVINNLEVLLHKSSKTGLKQERIRVFEGDEVFGPIDDVTTTSSPQVKTDADGSGDDGSGTPGVGQEKDTDDNSSGDDTDIDTEGEASGSGMEEKEVKTTSPPTSRRSMITTNGAWVTLPTTSRPAISTVFPKKPDTCVETNIRYAGNDLKTHRNVPSWETCSTLCRELAACKAWTWITPAFPWTPARNMCNLKSSDSGRGRYPGQLSGARQCGNGDHGKTCAEQDMNYVEGNINFIHNISSWKKCSSHCRDVTSCVAWVWITDKYRVALFRNVCVLKNRGDKKETLQGVVSGVRNCGDEGSSESDNETIVVISESDVAERKGDGEVGSVTPSTSTTTTTTILTTNAATTTTAATTVNVATTAITINTGDDDKEDGVDVEIDGESSGSGEEGIEGIINPTTGTFEDINNDNEDGDAVIDVPEDSQTSDKNEGSPPPLASN